MPSAFVVAYWQTELSDSIKGICVNTWTPLMVKQYWKVIHSLREQVSGGCSPVYCIVIQEKGQPDIIDRSYSGWHVCVYVRKRERQTDRQREWESERASKHSIASLACFPQHNLTACPLELRFPVQEKTKQTQRGVLFADSKSPWIRSISSLTSKKGRNVPWLPWAQLPPSTLPTGEVQVKAADVTTGSRDTNLIGCRSERCLFD